jgi:crotonobetainyl-CoA:carnitine CoA-transferase CaiB-like acyl-CoA transferase
MKQPPEQKPPRPLSGLKVIDMSTVLMGPLATQVLADYGADVIKIEPPEGDVMRHAGPSRTERMGPMYLGAGRNKRSVVIDIKRPGGREALLRLCESAAMFIHNIRQPAMARAGLAYEDLRKVSPSIVYLSLVGYGANGPYAHRPAFDDIIQAESGMAGLFHEAGGDVPKFIPMVMADRLTGLTAAHTALAALILREREGIGQAIEVPMFETVAQIVLGDHLGGEAFLPSLGPMGYNRLLTPNRRPYKTRDGYLAVTPYNDKQFRAFFAAIGRGDEVDNNPVLRTQSARARDYHVAYGLLAEIIETRTTAEWLQLCKEHEVPCAPVNSLRDLLEDPHLAAVGFFEEVDHPTEGRVRMIRGNTRWSKTDLSMHRMPPRIGADSLDVLREAGFSDLEIDLMLRDGATVDGQSQY